METGDVVKFLAPPLDKTSCEKLIQYYIEAKNDSLLNRWADATTKFGKFLELTAKIIHEYATTDTSVYACSKYVERIKAQTQLPKNLRLITTQIVLSGYNIRNDRDAAHPSTKIDSNELDCNYVSSSCDWILCELLIEFGDKDRAEADEIIRSILIRKVPIVYEATDGRLLLLDNEYPIWLKAAIFLYISKKPLSIEEIALGIREERRNIYQQMYRRKKFFYTLPNGKYELLPTGMAQVDEALSKSDKL